MARFISTVRRRVDRLAVIMTELRRLLGYLRYAGRAPVAVATVVMALNAAMPAATVIAAGVLVSRIGDEAGGGGDVSALTGPLFVLVVLIALADLLTSVLYVVGFWIGERIDGHVRSEVRKLLAAPEGVAHLEVQMVRDAAGVAASGLYDSTIGLAAGAQLWRLWRMAGAAGSTLLVLRFAPGVALIVFAAMVTQRIVLSGQARKLVEVGARAFAARRGADYWAGVAGGSDAAKEVRIYGLQEWSIERQREFAVSARQPIWDSLDKLLSRQWQMLGIAIGGALAGFGGLAVLALQGHLTIVELVISLGGVLGMAQIAFPGIEALTIEVGRACILALSVLRAMSPGDPREDGTASDSDAYSAGGPPRDAVPAHVRFEDLHFTYPGAQEPVLRGLNLEIAPGEKVAIVGANGAGKTTLMRLLAGFYRPQQGRVVIDGTDLVQVELAKWWREFAIVFQDFARLPASVELNVALSRAGFSGNDEHLDAVAAAAGLDEVIRRLPDGWATTLSSSLPGGTSLSGGQWQRIALARGLYAVRTGARILVLDEPTAQIDVAAEAEIFDRVLHDSHRATSVVISHRFSTVRRADRIVVLADGVIAEDGTHEQLMEQGGRYAAMYELQAASFRHDVPEPAPGGAQ